MSESASMVKRLSTSCCSWIVTAHVFLWTSNPIKSCFITYLQILGQVSYRIYMNACAIAGLTVVNSKVVILFGCCTLVGLTEYGMPLLTQSPFPLVARHF